VFGTAAGNGIGNISDTIDNGADDSGNDISARPLFPCFSTRPSPGQAANLFECWPG
jgi:hypothetical protein